MGKRLFKASRNRQRSPAYPHIGLREAVVMVGEIADAADGSATIPLTKAAEVFALKPTSSWLNVRLAALKKFGLIEDLSAGETRERMLYLTTSATLLTSSQLDDTTIRLLRQQAALRPPIYEDLWTRFGPILPGNEPMREYLVKERQFNPLSVVALLENFRSTVEYAELIEQAPSIRELAEAIPAHYKGRKPMQPGASAFARAMERLFGTTHGTGASDAAPVIGQSFSSMSSAQLRAMRKKVEEASGGRCTSIPLDGDEEALLQLPRGMTPQRWQTIIDTLELWKKQASSETASAAG